MTPHHLLDPSVVSEEAHLWLCQQVTAPGTSSRQRTQQRALRLGRSRDGIEVDDRWSCWTVRPLGALKTGVHACARLCTAFRAHCAADGGPKSGRLKSSKPARRAARQAQLLPEAFELAAWLSISRLTVGSASLALLGRSHRRVPAVLQPASRTRGGPSYFATFAGLYTAEELPCSPARADIIDKVG